MKRWLGSVTLAAFLVSFAAPPVAGRTDDHCGDIPATGLASFAAGMDHQSPDCGHGDADSCRLAIGCVTTAPAVAAARAPLDIVPATVVGGIAAPLHIVDSPRTGPPTPPPDLI